MNCKKRIAFITIGQSPRPDVTADFVKVWGDSFHIIESGALDNLSAKQIIELQPQSDESDLITKLADGQTVYVSHQRLLPYVQQAIERVADQGASMAIVLCTGDFDGVKASIPLLQPNKILAGSVAGMVGKGNHVAVFVPTAGQAEEAYIRWEKRGLTVARVEVVSPFDKPENFSESLLKNAAIQSSAAIIADCFSFNLRFKNALVQHFDKPIFIPRLLLAQLLTATL